MLADAKVSMKKFQFWTLTSFALMYFFLTPSFINDESFNVRVIVLLVSLGIAFVVGCHVLRLVRQSRNSMSSENLSEEEKVELYMAGFGVYVAALGLIVFIAVIFKLNLAYKFFFYQMIMGIAYFEQKRSIFRKYRKHTDRTNSQQQDETEEITIQEQSEKLGMKDE